MLPVHLPFEKTIYELDGTTDPAFFAAIHKYVQRILNNTTKCILREQDRINAQREISEADAVTDIDALMEQRAVGLILFDNQPLVTALLSLTDKQRKIIQMHYFMELSVGEIAFELGTSHQVVSSLLKRAVETLRLHECEIRKWEEDRNCVTEDKDRFRTHSVIT